MKAIFNNGAELEVIVVNGSAKHFQGASRDSLEFQIAPTVTTFDALSELFGNPTNCC